MSTIRTKAPLIVDYRSGYYSYNHSDVIIDATNNWWNLTDSTSISNSIIDYFHSNSYPKVNFVPFSLNYIGNYIYR